MWFDACRCVCLDAAHSWCARSLPASPVQSGTSFNTNCSVGCVPDPLKNGGKVLNLTGRDLPKALSDILSQGPTFALSRKICQDVLYRVEKGIERGAFALRWKMYLSSKKREQYQHTEQDQQQVTHTKQQQQQSTSSNNTDNTSHTSTQSTEQNGIAFEPLKMTPRFSDTDTKMAPPSDGTTERLFRSLKRRIMGCFKNHRGRQANHSREDIQALNEIRSDPEVIVKHSDKCKGFVPMPKKTYIEKAETITSQYEQVPKNPTPRLEAKTKMIFQNLGGKDPDKVISAIRPKSSMTAELYGLPKSHKRDVPP